MDEDIKQLTAALQRIGSVLGAMYASSLKDTDSTQKAIRLTKCGFSISEAADMVGVTANSVSIALHRQRKGKQARPRARRG